jgi:hypothetical protein
MLLDRQREIRMEYKAGPRQNLKDPSCCANRERQSIASFDIGMG